MIDRAKIVERVIADVNPRYTRTPPEALERTILCVLDVCERHIPGDLVECGVWKGGCSYAMLLAQRYAYGNAIWKPVWMYDSYEGMSPPVERDGSQAAYWWTGARDLPRDVPNENFCICPLDEVRQAIVELELGSFAWPIAGWLANTLLSHPKRSIAVLRIDCDWYEPVTACLDHLVPLVSPGGYVILDDWHSWEGCQLALADWRERTGIDWPLHEIDGKNGAWLQKPS